MRLTILGSNGTYPTPGRPASGYLVERDGTSVVLDLGPGVYLPLIERLDRPDAIVVSHVHPDHCTDMLALLAAMRARPRVEWGIPTFVPEGLPDRFAAFLGVDPDHALFQVFAFDVVGGGDRRSVGPFTLEFGTAFHSVPTLVTALDAGGRRLVYSGDTGPGGDLESLARGCDVLLCEATSQGDPPEGRYPYHLYAGEAGTIAARAGVRRLIVTHLAPTLDPGVSVAEAGTRFDGPVDHAVPGMEVEV
ncbi:MAG TPA: MBL fold metallo-hydrolase [Acidimicrobiia bacterium]|nr:MBL fold metallo-hydrolase [Acidimicrobiia bacterium]